MVYRTWDCLLLGLVHLLSHRKVHNFLENGSVPILSRKVREALLI